MADLASLRWLVPGVDGGGASDGAASAAASLTFEAVGSVPSIPEPGPW